MSSLRRKTLFKYVIPSILSNACIFLFTIVDGVFVGRGVGCQYCYARGYDCDCNQYADLYRRLCYCSHPSGTE